MSIFIVFAISLLCLSFDSTRLIGIIGLLLLSLVHPLLLIALLVLGGVILFFNQHK
jgi:hypothetical protein